MKDQNVTNVYRIVITKENKKIATKHLILTFASTKLPKEIKAGYLQCPVRPYIPNPLRCFKCQRFGHSKSACRGKLTCGRCSAVGHKSLSCNEPYRCVNCKENHPSYSKACAKWVIEKEIQTVRTKQNVSYSEAKKIVESRTPIVGKTYAAATSIISQKSYKSIAIQTDNLIANYNNTNNTSKSLKNNGSQSEINAENSSRQIENTPKPSNIFKPVTSKLSLHKKAVPNKSHNKKANVQNFKSNLKKNNSSNSKFREISYNPAKKK